MINEGMGRGGVVCQEVGNMLKGLFDLCMCASGGVICQVLESRGMVTRCATYVWG